MTKRKSQKRSFPPTAAERAAEAERYEKNRDDGFRRINSALQYFTVCSSRACKRAKACVGKPVECHERWWPHVPEDLKWHLRALMQARRDGVPRQDRVRVACEQVARWQELEQRLEAREAERLNAPAQTEPQAAVADPTATASVGPRIRSL